MLDLRAMLLCLLLAGLHAVLPADVAAQSMPVEPLDRAIADSAARVSATLLPEAQDALARIRGKPRQLLALRSYLRARESLAARWSWSEAQIKAYEQSDEHARMLAEIAKVTARFELLNPGYSLYANTQVRSLEVQLERWNSNPTVGRVADELHGAMRESMSQMTAVGSAIAPQTLAQFLVEWQPSAAVPLAAPGISLHGQMRALDFQIRAGDRIVAGPQTATVAQVWEAQGWARKLARAVAQSSSRFSGPLAVPNEPWHFEYVGDGSVGRR